MTLSVLESSRIFSVTITYPKERKVKMKTKNKINGKWKNKK